MNKNLKIKKKEYKFFIDTALIEVKKRNFIRAKELFLKAKKIDETRYEAYINISNLEILEGNLNQSINRCKKYISKYGFNEKIINHFGLICIKYNLSKKLEEILKLCNLNFQEKKKQFYFIYFLNALSLEKQEKYEKSINSYIFSLQCNKNFFESYINLLNLLELKNDIKKFEKYLNIVNKISKNKEQENQIFYYYALLFNRKKNFEKSNDLISEKKLIYSFRKSDDMKIKVLNLLFKNSEKLGNFKLAFESIMERNKLLINLDGTKKINNNVLFETIDKYRLFFTKRNVESITKKINSKNKFQLVFLVGFPRSGTTLLDTILRTHSKVSVIEEKPFLMECRNKFLDKNNNNLVALKNISQDDLLLLRDYYFKKIEKFKKKNQTVIIDKLPLSIIEIGFIKSLFPEAKIILALRHPCDVVFSCFFNSFKINEAMINFLQLDKTIKLYKEVFELFEFYENELNFKYFKIRYEDIVYNFKKNITLLLNYLELNYEKNLENYFYTALKRDKISTPSYSQVINPLYDSSINKWKNYYNLINPEADLNKWIEKFNY